MALHDEQADILGGPILQRPESGLFAALSQYLFVFKSVTLFGFCLLVWIACVRGLEHLKKHRELRYRKAMRRKHGIPDSDCRPFAVAYAAAKRARLEREAQDRKKLTNMSDHELPDDQRTNAQKDIHALRRRVPETTVHLHDYQPAQKHVSVYDKRPEVHSLGFNNFSARRQTVIPESLIQRPPVRRAGRQDFVINLDDNEESRKRSLEEVSDLEHETVKKSRLGGGELMDEDKHPDWYSQYSDAPLRRVPRASPDQQLEDYVYLNGQERSGRVRDPHDEDDHQYVDETMQGIDEDEVTELKAVARGRKRDRAEAGSTFGGDDDEDTRNGKTSHLRKRRTIFRRGVELSTRGQKRDRDVESLESDGEGDGWERSERRPHCGSKKKRGKKFASEEVDEPSMGDPRVSKDPLCSGRRVGEEWELDGIHFKVGDKGERLRLTLVKKARNKYHMPQDSQHPDRSAALEIYVETWLTEEQYKQAEERQELAWQEMPKESDEFKTSRILDSPTKNGKNLLWDSVKDSPVRRPFRQLMLSGSSSRINPFEQWPSQPTLGRRVASSSTIASPLLPGVADSPTRPGFRGFSKWEKQDREAEAMARIRAKMEVQKKAQQLPKKPVETSIIAPELGTKPLSVPTITLTPAPTVAALERSDENQQSKSSSFSLTAPAGAGDAAKGPVTAISTAAGLSPGTSAIPSSTLSTTSSSFASTTPPQAPSAASSAVPNFFAKMLGSNAQSVASPAAPSTTAHPQPPIESSSKSIPFSFAKSDTSSSSSTTTVPTTMKSQIPNFGAPSSSLPPPATFGSAAATTKVDVSAHLVSTISTTPENSKPVTPLFSFTGASSSAPPAVPTNQSTSSLPKFSFGQSPAPSTFAAGSNPTPSSTSQPKLSFKFGQTPSSTSADGASTPTALAVAAVAEPKKSPMPVSAFGTAGLNEPAKPSPFGTSSGFGTTPALSNSISSSSPASATTLFGKSTAADGDAPTIAQPNPTTTFNTFPSQSTGTPVSGTTPIFSFSAAKPGFSSEESKSAPSFGGATGDPNVVSAFGGSSSESRGTFNFTPSAEGSKSTPIFGGNKENTKTLSVFGSSADGPKSTFAFSGSTQTAKPSSVFPGIAEGPKPTFTFGISTEQKTGVTDVPKPDSNVGNTLGSSSSLFPFSKDETASGAISTQTKPATPFAFGSATSNAISGQGSPFASGSNLSQTIFGKSTDAKPSSFGFPGTGGSSSSGTFTFSKPVTQNQNQEQ